MQLFEALEGNLEHVLVGKLGGVVDNIDPEKGNDRHFGGVLDVDVDVDGDDG